MPLSPLAGPRAARYGPEAGGCGSGHAWKRLRSFSLDNVTAPGEWAGDAVLRRCGRLPLLADHPSPETGSDGCAGGARLAPPTAHPAAHPL